MKFPGRFYWHTDLFDQIAHFTLNQPQQLSLLKFSRQKRRSVIRLRSNSQSTVKASEIAHHKPSQISTQHRQYWPNSFKPSNKLIENIPMGKMVDGLNGVQQ
jgi:hypothetical protein